MLSYRKRAISQYLQQNVSRDHRCVYRYVADKLIGYLKTRNETRGSGDVRTVGAIAGSYPLWGKYIHYCYPNWAAKYFAESIMLKMKIKISGI